MDFFLKPDFPKAHFQISHKDRLLLIGSCFTSNVGKQLDDLQFNTVHNPTGILFDPFSVERHLRDALESRFLNEDHCVQLNEVWHSFNHHTDFSSVNKEALISGVNSAIVKTVDTLQSADILFITLGSAYYYRLASSQERIANCHRFPAATFTKHLAETVEIVDVFTALISDVRRLNPSLKIVFTVSPVRHIREGVVNNNRSKARLLESVHLLSEQLRDIFYFPAYEIVIDILRDYRFYDVDMVHPNYQTTQFVFDQFKSVYFSNETQGLCQRIREVVTAYRHKPNFPHTKAHQTFLKNNLEKVVQLETEIPTSDWTKLKTYFSEAI